VAVCDQVRSFDLDARGGDGSAAFVESLDAATTAEIVARAIRVIDPAEA
jgi:mRNA interferase ChpB